MKQTFTVFLFLITNCLFAQDSTKHTISEGYQIKAALLQDISGKTLSTG
jgi:hypothetical protein